MDIQILNTYDSEANKVAHSGYLTRAPAIRKSDVIAAELVRQATERNIKIQYDITYENYPHELTFTECFGGAGGIYIRPADSEFSRELLQTGPVGDRNVDFLLDCTNKYVQFDMYCDFKHVIFLTGSNFFGDYPPETVRSFMRKDTMIKPHPITAQFFRFCLMKEFPYRVLPLRASAVGILRQVDAVTVTPHTELGLYARLMGKEVTIMSSTVKRTPAYGFLYETGDDLRTALSTHLRGIIFPGGDYAKEISEFLDRYQQQLIAYKNSNNRGNVWLMR
jgi:hypothetical protein